MKGLVLGLLDTSAEAASVEAAVRARDLTISWSRFKYGGPILEDHDLDALLRRAAAGDARYCLVQSWGHVLHEVWSPDGQSPFDLLDLLDGWVEGRGFLVAGRIVEPSWDGNDWWGLDRTCLLVDLDTYRALGEPPGHFAADAPTGLPAAEARRRPDRTVARLDPSSHGERDPRDASPGTGSLPGAAPLFASGLVRASLDAGLPVYDLAAELDAGAAHLGPEVPACAAALVGWQGEALRHFDAELAGRTFGPRELRFLTDLQRLSGNLRRGVFVWNIESYADVEEPPPGFAGPLSSLYSVAAGLKPNFLLERLGFDDRTRVVFADYSEPGLEFRRLLLSDWDGSDYPAFLRRLFRDLPPDRAFYLLWQGCTPEDLDWDEVATRWREELDRWGGASVLRTHWARYRRLPHEFLHCDLVEAPEQALATLRDEPSAAIWWSNSFFSVHSNWHHDASRRRELYRRWISGLAARAPRLWLYGASSDNASVNGVRAGEYSTWYRGHGGDELEPGRFHRVELRS